MKISSKASVKQRSEVLLSVDFILALVLLFLNDTLFKYSWPNFITGKLSDFAGLYLFPLFVNIFIRDKLKVYLGTAVLFIIWKASLSQPFIDYWNNISSYHIDRIVDYTDLMALSVLSLAYYRRNSFDNLSNIRYKPLFKYVIGGFSLIVILATAGTHGLIKRYPYNFSKQTVSKALLQIVNENRQYLVPDSLSGRFNIDAQTSKSIDTFSFNFYFPDSKVGKVYWATFMGRNEDWTEPACNFDLVGVKTSDGKSLYEKDLNSEDKAYVKEVFESEIVSKLDDLLKQKR
jgi:hypothetical protein